MSTPDSMRAPETLAATRAALRRAIAGEPQAAPDADPGEFVPGRGGRSRRAGFPRSTTMRVLLNPRTRALGAGLLAAIATLSRFMRRRR